jgi:hypothetical protein
MRDQSVKTIATSLIFTLIAWHTATAQTSRYAGDPLLLGAGARALGMGSAYVALSHDATAVYWNPAGLSQLPKREIHVQHAEQFGGSINHDLLAFGLPITNGGIGVGLVRTGVDGITLTTLEDPTRPIGPDNRPIVTNVVGTTDYIFRLAYGRIINQKLHLGLGLKIIRRDLTVGVGNGFGLNLGLTYLPAPAIRIGAMIRDITRTRIAFPNGITDRISPSLLIGIATERTVPKGLFTASVSAHLNDQKSSGEESKSLQLGLEYLMKRRIAFRLGYKEGHFTAGTGLHHSNFAIDLAFLEHEQLDNTYRISATLFF